MLQRRAAGGSSLSLSEDEMQSRLHGPCRRRNRRHCRSGGQTGKGSVSEATWRAMPALTRRATVGCCSYSFLKGHRELCSQQGERGESAVCSRLLTQIDSLRSTGVLLSSLCSSAKSQCCLNCCCLVSQCSQHSIVELLPHNLNSVHLPSLVRVDSVGQQHSGDANGGVAADHGACRRRREGGGGGEREREREGKTVTAVISTQCHAS